MNAMGVACDVTIEARPRMCTCCDPPRRMGIWDARSVSGPKAVQGYHVTQTSPEVAAEGVESALRAVFPNVGFSFRRVVVTED